MRNLINRDLLRKQVLTVDQPLTIVGDISRKSTIAYVSHEGYVEICIC
jgi:hypothetical protein